WPPAKHHRHSRRHYLRPGGGVAGHYEALRVGSIPKPHSRELPVYPHAHGGPAFLLPAASFEEHGLMGRTPLPPCEDATGGRWDGTPIGEFVAVPGIHVCRDLPRLVPHRRSQGMVRTIAHWHPVPLR